MIEKHIGASAGVESDLAGLEVESVASSGGSDIARRVQIQHLRRDKPGSRKRSRVESQGFIGAAKRARDVRGTRGKSKASACGAAADES